VVTRIQSVDEANYQRILAILFPDPLDPPIISVIQETRHLARTYEHLHMQFARDIPQSIASAILLGASNFTMELRRHTSLGHLVHSANVVFQNPAAIEEMVSFLFCLYFPFALLSN